MPAGRAAADADSPGAATRVERARTLLSTLGVDPGQVAEADLLELGAALDAMDGAAGALPPGEACVDLGGGFELSTTRTTQDGAQQVSVRLTGPNVELTLRPERDATGGLTTQARLVTSDGRTMEGQLRAPGRGDAAPESADDAALAEGSAALDALGSDEEGDVARSFARGAFLGDFGEDDSWAALGGQTVVGFIPVVGQIADLRDLAAALRATARGEPGAHVQLGAAILGVVPGLDFLKAARVADRRVLRAASEELGEVAESGMKHAAKKLSKEAIATAKAQLKQLAVGRAELVARLEELAKTPGLSQQMTQCLARARRALGDHLDAKDLVGALRDILGLPVKKGSTGEVFNHAQEVEQALGSLKKLVEALKTEARHQIERGADPAIFSILADALEEYRCAVDVFLGR